MDRILWALPVAVLIVAVFRSLGNGWFGDMQCRGCGRQWIARGARVPKQCPSCRSPHIHAVGARNGKPAAQVPSTPLSAFPLIDPRADVYTNAVTIVRTTRRATISGVQRRLRISFEEASDLLARMEAEGIVSPVNELGDRTVLVPAEDG